MKKSWLSFRGRFVLGVCLATIAAVSTGESRALAQQGQGVYITQAAGRLSKLVDKANGEKYSLQNNSFSIGGGWLKKGEAWVSIYTVDLTAGKQYRFLAAGDNDAKDVDLRVMDAKGEKELAADVDTAADAVVNFTPTATGRYVIQIRLYSSREDLDAVCLSVMMQK